MRPLLVPYRSVDTSQVSTVLPSNHLPPYNLQKGWGLLRISSVSPETHETPFQGGMWATVGSHRTFKMGIIRPNPRKQSNPMV